MKQVCLCIRHRKTALHKKMPSERSHKEDALQTVLKIYFFGKLGAFSMFDILAGVFLSTLCVLLGTGRVPSLTCLVTSVPVLPQPRPSPSLVPMGPPLTARLIASPWPLGLLCTAPRGPGHCPSSPAHSIRPSPPISPLLEEARGHLSTGHAPPPAPRPAGSSRQPRASLP